MDELLDSTRVWGREGATRRGIGSATQMYLSGLNPAFQPKGKFDAILQNSALEGPT